MGRNLTRPKFVACSAFILAHIVAFSLACEPSGGIIVTHLCCGDVEYKVNEKRCCQEDPPILAKEDSERCCGSRIYKKQTQMCCNGKIVNGNDKVCCGTKGFTRGSQACCDPKREILVSGESCCRTTSYPTTNHVGYHPKTHRCCSTPEMATPVPFRSCCYSGGINPHTGYDSTDPTQACCYCQLTYQLRKQGKLQCDMTPKIYNPTKQQCCFGNVSHKNESCCDEKSYKRGGGQVCCVVAEYGKQEYHDLFSGDRCCTVESHTEEVTEGSYRTIKKEIATKGYWKDRQVCCGGKVSAKEGQMCCSGKLVPEEEGANCCGDEGLSYKRASQSCCYVDKEKKHRVVEGRNQRCCHNEATGEVKPYGSGSKCCGGQLYPYFSTVTKCCNVGEVWKMYNIGTQTCCNSKLMSGSGGCCANLKTGAAVLYDVSTEECCGDKVIPKGNCRRCIGSRTTEYYDKQSHVCCQTKDSDSSDKGIIKMGTACCGSEGYDPTKQSCCKGKLVDGTSCDCTGVPENPLWLSRANNPCSGSGKAAPLVWSGAYEAAEGVVPSLADSNRCQCYHVTGVGATSICCQGRGYGSDGSPIWFELGCGRADLGLAYCGPWGNIAAKPAVKCKGQVLGTDVSFKC